MAKITEVSHQQSLQTKCKMLVAITIYALLAFMSQKRFTHFWHLCRGNDLRTSSGKFLRVKVCRPESCDFLGLCHTVPDSPRKSQRVPDSAKLSMVQNYSRCKITQNAKLHQVQIYTRCIIMQSVRLYKVQCCAWS